MAVANPLYAVMGRTRFAFLVSLAAIISMTCRAQEQNLNSPEPDEPGTISRAGNAASSAFLQTRTGLADAAMAPLEDLNLRREEIPPVLAMLDNPYDLPHAIGCYEIAAMIRDLDAVLGPDWDAQRTPSKQWDRLAADGVASAALSAVSSEASGMIPFRGVVRKLSQAEKHARAYARAVKIGGQRRAFLKGVGHAKGCIGSAAPRWVEAAEGTPEMYRQIQLSAAKEEALREEAERIASDAAGSPENTDPIGEEVHRLEAEAHQLEEAAHRLEEEAHRLEDEAETLEAEAQRLEKEAESLKADVPLAEDEAEILQVASAPTDRVTETVGDNDEPTEDDAKSADFEAQVPEEPPTPREDETPSEPSET